MKRLISKSLREKFIQLIQKIAAFLFSGGKVGSGPFQGIKYISSSYMSAYYPKILGVYERELWQVLEYIVDKKPNHILNIGAAEGYYAVGLAKRLPQTKIITFEQNQGAQDMIEMLANINDVEDQIRIDGTCSVKDLKETLDQVDKPFIIIDIEGAEGKLLDLQNIPKLRNCEILLEVHEFEDPMLPADIKNRFKDSHVCTEILAEERSLNDLPMKLPNFLIDTVFGRSLKLMMDEQRIDGKRWFHLKPIT